jgi:hypothetical protein
LPCERAEPLASTPLAERRSRTHARAAAVLAMRCFAPNALGSTARMRRGPLYVVCPLRCSSKRVLLGRGVGIKQTAWHACTTPSATRLANDVQHGTRMHCSAEGLLLGRGLRPRPRCHQCVLAPPDDHRHRHRCAARLPTRGPRRAAGLRLPVPPEPGILLRMIPR